MQFRNNFVENSILGVTSFFRDSVFSDEHALKRGFLQLLDARIKVFTFIIFIFTAILIKSAALLLFLYIFCLMLAVFSRIPLGFFFKRTLLFIPLFSFFIALPAFFSAFNTAILFIARVITTVSFVVLLGLVTKHSELLSVLTILKVPKVFVMILGMCYRYIFLFAKTIEDTYTGIKSRVGIRMHYKRGQKIVAWNIACLWQKSSGLNEQVYAAMVSRGYGGESFVLEEFKISFRDWAWLFFSIAVFALFVYLNYG